MQICRSVNYSLILAVSALLSSPSHCQVQSPCRCMAAIQSFTDPKTLAVPTDSSHDVRRLVLGIFPGQKGSLRAGAAQAPAWTKGSSGQGRLQTALGSLRAATNTPGRSACACLCLNHPMYKSCHPCKPPCHPANCSPLL